MGDAVGDKPLRLVLPQLYMAVAKPAKAQAANRTSDVAAARHRHEWRGDETAAKAFGGTWIAGFRGSPRAPEERFAGARPGVGCPTLRRPSAESTGTISLKIQRIKHSHAG
jgi:hypothetical protein